MTDAPVLTRHAEAQRAERLAREALALRRNLLLRKHQQRARAESATPEPARSDAPDAAS